MRSKRRPLFERVKAPPIRITDDDVAIINHVAAREYAQMSGLIRRFSHRSAKHLRTRVRKLYDHGYLDLPNAQQFDHLTKGRPEKIYALGDKGAALLAERFGRVMPKSNWRDKNRSVKRRHIHHKLRIGDLADCAERTTTHLPHIELINDAEILSNAPPGTQRDPKPWLWEVRVRTADGSLRAARAVPDGVFGFDLTDQRQRYYFFVEADRGTMPVVRSTQAKTAIIRKFEVYLAGFHSRLHQTRYNIHNLRFLIVTTSQKRIGTMLDAFGNIEQSSDCSMFRFADKDQITTADHLLAVPWRDGSGKPVALLD